MMRPVFALAAFAACTDPPTQIVSTPPYCGDGIVNGSEQCDDGARNGAPGDSCSATCSIAAWALCGNGVLDGAEQCDDGANNGKSGYTCAANCTLEVPVAVSWSFETLSTGTPGACPTGFDTAVVISERMSNGTIVDAPVVDVFDCSVGTGNTSPLVQGSYQTWVEIRQGGVDGPEYGRSPSVFTSVDLNATPIAMPPILGDGGYFHVNWGLFVVSVYPAASWVVSCEEEGVAAVSVQVDGPTTAVTSVFPCTDVPNDNADWGQAGVGSNYTQGFVAGTYTVSVSALDANMKVVSAPPPVTELVISPQGITEVSAISIAFPL